MTQPTGDMNATGIFLVFFFLSNYVSMGGRVMVDTRIPDCINQPSIFSLRNDTTAFQHVPKGMNWFLETCTSPTLGVQCTVFWDGTGVFRQKLWIPPPKKLDDLTIGRVDPKIWGLKTKSLPPYLCLSPVTTFQQLILKALTPCFCG